MQVQTTQIHQDMSVLPLCYTKCNYPKLVVEDTRVMWYSRSKGLDITTDLDQIEPQIVK